MLSPREDDDDDSHLCIKCNATIVGLDNYVKHRKQRCGKHKVATNKADISSIDPLEPSYSLGADVFFQSLELQSSAKKTSLSRLTPPIPISKSIERRATLALASTSRDARMSPLETNLRGEDWIGGHCLRIGGNEDNQTKLINAVANISGAVKKDLAIASSSYGISSYNDFKVEDESDESDDMDDEDDEEAPTSEVKWKPPPNYTGGKWRPASPEHEDWDMREPEHTGGKWKPLEDTNDRDEDYDAPPPDHTKGKWVPGAHDKTQIMQTTIQTKGSIIYWCGPCNRRLGSKTIYEKHLMSNLHLRKVLPESELEFSGQLRPKRNTEKRTSRPSIFTNNTIYSQIKRKRKHTAAVTEKKAVVLKKRKRKPIFVHCSGCKSRVRLHLMGKHLISHYHFRKATQTNSHDYQQLILNNMGAIVHQSPFQCSPCKFYTNWLSNFMQHWFTEEHEKKTSLMEGMFWCSFCKFECVASDTMLEHLTSSEHNEVVAVINRSMPIVIRKKSNISCKVCKKQFRYNIEVKKHCGKMGHELAHTATDAYQEMHNCTHCEDKFKSSITLAAHLKAKHRQNNNRLCLVCSKEFETREEAIRHRQSSEHKIMRKERMRERGLPVKEQKKKCPHCLETVMLKNVLELKDHIRIMHPNEKKKCSKCGMSFILPQEVTWHVRSNACQFPATDTINPTIMWNCSQCLFTTDSQAECFFHEILHTAPIETVRKIADDVTKIVLKYPCPICSKYFNKPSLRSHLRQHTFERPFLCSNCGANFTRQSSLDRHFKVEHSLIMPSEPKLGVLVEKEFSKELQTCERCKKIFNNQSTLSRHRESCLKSDELKCPYESCSFVGSASSQLARHRRTTHGELVKHHECNLCWFKTDQSSHFKRHMRCHQGVKPYACPYCEFKCGSLENLRKHVLRSGRHKELYLYKCNLCSYPTNMATELKKHLVAEHSDKYNKKTAQEFVKNVLFVQKET